MSAMRGKCGQVHLQVNKEVKITMSGRTGKLKDVSDLKIRCIASKNINTWIKMQQLKERKSS